MGYYIGIDVGTSSTKAIVVDGSGNVVFSIAPDYDFQTPRPGWAECDPELWWDATITALKAIAEKFDSESISGIGLSGQMHGLVLLDAEGSVLRPCIMWNDQRTAAECAELTEAVGSDTVLSITGNPILPGFTAPKIRWVQKHEPKTWEKVSKILLPKDFIRFKLSGEFFTEVSDASGMSLLDVGKRNWSDTMCKACHVEPSMLAEVTESIAVSSHLSSGAATKTGLKAGTPIVGGGGDQAAGAVGCGIVRSGRISCTLGTSGVVFAHADHFEPEPKGRLHAFCAAVPGKWHYMGVQLSCAGSYQWFHDKLGGGLSFEEINQLAEAAPAGSEGLLFLPYLSGERTPHPDPNARGVFFGLSLRHGLGHMARSVMEGVSYGLRDALEMMRELGISPSEVIVSGGGARSSLWRQILADNFQAPIVSVNAVDGAAYGAAVLAAVGVGDFESVEAACDQMIGETGRTLPGEKVGAYNAFHPHYTQLYPALKQSFSELAETVEGSL